MMFEVAANAKYRIDDVYQVKADTTADSFSRHLRDRLPVYMAFLWDLSPREA